MIDPPTYRHRGGSIIEFETDWDTIYNTMPVALVWRGKIAIDLRWVASASPSEVRDGCSLTNVTMCGSSHSVAINIPYEDFMVLWMAAK